MPTNASVEQQIQQIPVEHLRRVELDEVAYRCLGNIVLQKPEITLDDFENHYNSVFLGESEEDPDHGYKVTAAFEQLQADGTIALTEQRQPSANTKRRFFGGKTNDRTKPEDGEPTYVVDKHTPNDYKKNKKAFYKESKRLAKEWDKSHTRQERKSGSADMAWSHVLLGNRKVRHSRDRSEDIGRTLSDISKPLDTDSAPTQWGKAAVRVWGRDSIEQHRKRQDDAIEDAIKLQTGIARANFLASAGNTQPAPVIQPEVAAWAKNRETVVQFIGNSAIETEPSVPGRLSVAEMKKLLFTEQSVKDDIIAAYKTFISRAGGSGKTPEEGLVIREKIIRAQAQKSVTRLAGNSPAPANIIASYADLLLQQYAGELGRNTIRDYEDLKKQLASA